MIAPLKENQDQIGILQRALKREKAARKAAEKILEDKSRELYSKSEELTELLNEKSSTLEGVFKNINDAYLVMDLYGNVLEMNEVAIEVFGYDINEEAFNLTKVVYKEDIEYTAKSFSKLYEEGSFNDYTARIVDKNNNIKWIEVNCSIIYNKENKPVAAQGIVRDISEWVRMKKQLEDQKNQLSIIINNSPIGITLSRNDQKGLLLINNSLKEMLGYSSEELENIKVGDLTHPEDIEKSKKLTDQLYKGVLRTYNLEKRYIKKNGNVLWAKVTVTAVKDDNNIINYNVVTVEDIEKERLDKEKIIESENRLSALVLNLNSGIILEDENRKIVLSNTKFCQLFNLDVQPTDLIGMDCREASEQNKVLFKDSSNFVQRMNEIVENKVAVFGEELKMVDGKILERNYTPVIVNGKIKGYLWAFSDVTLEKKYNLSLEVEKEKYSNIIANMNLGLVEINIDDQISMVNQSFLEMSGYAKEELLGKVGRDIFTFNGDLDIIKDQKEKRLRGESTSYELKTKNKKGETKYWLVSAAPNYNLFGENIGSIALSLDITEIKKLELQKEQILKELEKSNEHLHEYAHIVSHDLKSPLRSLDALISWIKTDNEGKFDEITLQNFDLLETTLETMEKLISDVLEYSSAGSSTQEDQEVNLNTTLCDLQKVLFIPENISVNVLKVLPVLKGDKTKFQQLFQNFISNAIKFCDKETGLVEIDYKDKDTFHQFSVKDNGIGIEKKYHSKIFEVFTSLNKREDSTGIGLSIVKKIIDLHEGEIWLESELNKGTTFYFTIKKN